MGTGKATVLALRAAEAIERGLVPENILCLSFTNKAAREVKSRLMEILGPAASETSALTFHGLRALIPRNESDALGIPGDFVIYDEEDAREVMGRLWA